MHRSPAEPYPADTAASAARSISASGSTIMWFLAPTKCLDSLPVTGPGLVDVAGDGGGADEGDGGDAGVSKDGVDRFLVAMDHIEHPLGKPGLGEQLGAEHRR